MWTEIKRIWYTINNLKQKVNCVCNRPTIPPLPTDDGLYLLGVSDGVYTWVSI